MPRSWYQNQIIHIGIWLYTSYRTLRRLINSPPHSVSFYYLFSDGGVGGGVHGDKHFKKGSRQMDDGKQENEYPNQLNHLNTLT